jgi:hypothetical protein
LKEKELKYCQQFHICDALGYTSSKTLKTCNQLLTGKLNRFIDLLESLYEVGYYWKRLTETDRLLEASAPTTSTYQIKEASWLAYNLDSYWHASYGLEDRIMKFLTIFERIYKSPSSEEFKHLETWKKGVNKLNTEATKKARDPLAHYRSLGVQGWRDAHHWEAILFRKEKPDLIKIHENNYLQHKDLFIAKIHKWIPKYNEIMSIIFDGLCNFNLNKLE